MSVPNVPRITRSELSGIPRDDSWADVRSPHSAAGASPPNGHVVVHTPMPASLLPGLADESTPLVLDKPPPPKATSFSGTVLNTSNALLGIGVLALPYALRLSGWCGLIVIAVLGLVFDYTGHIIGRCMAAVPPSVTTYPGLGDVAFGWWGRATVVGVFYVELFSICCIFLLIDAENLHKLSDSLSVREWAVVTGVILLPSVWLRHLRFLAYVSLVGLVASGLLLVAVLWEGYADGSLLHGASDTVFFAGWDTFPVAVTLITFAYGGHALFPSIYASMEDPGRYGRALDWSFLITTLSYMAMAGIGYHLYGGKTADEITLNIPSGGVGLLALVAVIISPLTKFPLNIIPMSAALEAVLGIEAHRWGIVASILLRSGLVALMVLVTILIPFFALISSLIGALLSMSVASIFPALIYTRLFWHELRTRDLIVNAIIFALGVMFAAIGTISSFRSNL